MEQHVPTVCVIVCQSGRFRLIHSMGSPWSLTAIERELKLGGKGRVDRGGELPPKVRRLAPRGRSYY